MTRIRGESPGAARLREGFALAGGSAAAGSDPLPGHGGDLRHGAGGWGRGRRPANSLSLKMAHGKYIYRWVTIKKRGDFP